MRFLRERNMDWGDLIAPARAASHRLALFDWLLASPALNAWERSFVANLDNYQKLSRKQRDVLATIVAKAVQ
jgi:hypothetical protein